MRLKTYSRCLFLAGLTATLAAAPAPQSTPAPAAENDGKREFTITGCLLRSGYAGYQVDGAQLDLVDGKAVAGAATSTSTDWPKKWILDGGGNLGANTGRRVQVTGRSDWQPPSSAAAPDEPPNRTPHLDVKSVKLIAPACS